MSPWFTRRRLIGLVVLLAVVLGLVVGDVFLRQYVENRIESEVGQVADGRVTADVGGWPATWQVVRDDYDRITGQVDGAVATVLAEEIVLDVDVVAQDVRGLAGGEVVIGSGSGRAATRWEDLSRVTGVELSGGDDGMLTITTQVGVLGERLPVRVTGRPVVDGRSGQLGLQDAQASLDEVDVPQDVIDGLLPRVSTYVYLPTFEGLRWTGVQVTQDGVELDFRAEEMTVPTW